MSFDKLRAAVYENTYAYAYKRKAILSHVADAEKDFDTLKQLLIQHVAHCNPRFQSLTGYGQKCANHADELARKYLNEIDPHWARQKGGGSHGE